MRKQGTVLALDLATNLGWAWHSPGKPRPFWGHERLPGSSDDVGQRCDRLEKMLRDQFIMLRGENPISHIIFEAQHMGSQMNMQTVYCLIGLGATVEKFAYQVGVLCYKAEISKWRKHFIGRGSAYGDDDPKVLVQERCNQLGWHTKTFDESDALGVLDYSLTQLPNYDRPWRDNALMKGRR